jgi:hypothetical protein
MLTTNPYERTKPVFINKKIIKNKNAFLTKNDYNLGLKQNFFDPSKSSPPNDFMIKLHMRMNKYHINNADGSLVIK